VLLNEVCVHPDEWKYVYFVGRLVSVRTGLICLTVRTSGGLFEQVKKISGSLNCGIFFDWLRNCKFNVQVTVES